MTISLLLCCMQDSTVSRWAIMGRTGQDGTGPFLISSWPDEQSDLSSSTFASFKLCYKECLQQSCTHRSQSWVNFIVIAINNNNEICIPLLEAIRNYNYKYVRWRTALNFNFKAGSDMGEHTVSKWINYNNKSLGEEDIRWQLYLCKNSHHTVGEMEEDDVILKANTHHVS